MAQALPDYVNSIFSEIKEKNYLQNCSIEEIQFELAYYLNEINILHPFREGNGRTQRIFIKYLAKCAGYDTDFETVSKQEMIDASIDGFRFKYEKMNNIFKRITTPISSDEKIEFQKAINFKLPPKRKRR
jgi:cell filamentation protein